MNFICEKCDTPHLTEKKLIGHKKNVHGILPTYYCPVKNCSIGLPSSRALKTHMNENHDSNIIVLPLKSSIIDSLNLYLVFIKSCNQQKT